MFASNSSDNTRRGPIGLGGNRRHAWRESKDTSERTRFARLCAGSNAILSVQHHGHRRPHDRQNQATTNSLRHRLPQSLRDLGAIWRSLFLLFFENCLIHDLFLNVSRHDFIVAEFDRIATLPCRHAGECPCIGGHFRQRRFGQDGL